MEKGNLVVTLPWEWHDHGSDSNAPVIWMAGLDIPLVRGLDTSFFEPSGGWTLPPEKPKGNSESRYASRHLRPAWEWPDLSGPPLFVYK